MARAKKNAPVKAESPSKEEVVEPIPKEEVPEPIPKEEVAKPKKSKKSKEKEIVEAEDDEPKEKQKRKPSEYNMLLGQFLKKISEEEKAKDEKDKDRKDKIPKDMRMKVAYQMYKDFKMQREKDLAIAVDKLDI